MRTAKDLMGPLFTTRPSVLLAFRRELEHVKYVLTINGLELQLKDTVCFSMSLCSTKTATTQHLGVAEEEMVSCMTLSNPQALSTNTW